MTPLAVHRGPCRFGAPERAVSSRFEIDSGPGDACVRARARAQAREGVRARVRARHRRESNLGFCRARPRATALTEIYRVQLMWN